MRKQLPLVEEVPLIAVGLAVAAAGALAATVIIDAARLVARVTGLDRPATQPRGAH